MKTQPYKLESIDRDFDSSMLKSGEMMEIIDGKLDGLVILCTYDRYVLLNSPSSVWEKGTRIMGRKLSPGEGITLIQG